MLNIGLSIPEDIARNLAIPTTDTIYTNEDGNVLAKFSARVYESKLVKEMEVT